jgi:hypothetical protein
MMNKPCFRPDNRIRNSLFAALLVAAAFCFPSSAAASAPEWLRALSRVPVPSYPKETDAVMLLNEQSTVVKDSGEIVTIYHRAYKILRPKGRELGTVVVYFDNETRLTYLKAWSIPPDGKEFEVKEKDAVELSLGGDNLFDDTHYKFLKIPASEPGNIIGYEYEQKRRPNVLQDRWNFQEDIPVRLARFSLQLPAGWEFKPIWMQHAEVAAKQSGNNLWTWEIADVPAIEHEFSMPPWPAIAGRLAVVYFPRNNSAQEKVQDSWRDVGKWYAGLAAPSRQTSPEIQQKVKDLTSGAATPMEKIRALSAFVQKEIRYVAIEVGIGGYQPHSARDVLIHRYGDCKDKVTLLSTMLNEVGVESYYVLTNSERGYITATFPSMMNFDHVILAARLPQGVPADAMLTIQDHPKLGNLFYFDPTSTSTPFGSLPSSLQANYGLLVAPDGGELLRMPLLPGAANRLQRSGKLHLDATGTLSGTVQELRLGEPAIERRAELQHAKPGERTKVLESFLATFLNGAQLTTASAENMDEAEKDLILRFGFVAENYAKTAGNLLLLRPRVLGQKGDDILEEEKERKYPVEFSTASIQTDVYEISLPSGYKVDELPPPLKVDCGYVSYESKIELVGDVLRYQRTYQVRQVMVPVEKLPELKKFYRQVAADERSNAVLKRSN